MVLKISTEILNYINESDYDENTKHFLIQALLLEFKRDKEDVKHYTNEYDKLIEKYIEKVDS